MIYFIFFLSFLCLYQIRIATPRMHNLNLKMTFWWFNIIIVRLWKRLILQNLDVPLSHIKQLTTKIKQTSPDHSLLRHSVMHNSPILALHSAKLEVLLMSICSNCPHSFDLVDNYCLSWEQCVFVFMCETVCQCIHLQWYRRWQTVFVILCVTRASARSLLQALWFNQQQLVITAKGEELTSLGSNMLWLKPQWSEACGFTDKEPGSVLLFIYDLP